LIPDPPHGSEAVDINLFRQKKLQKRLLLESTRLGNAKQLQIVDSASPVERSGNLPLHRKMPDRPLGRVVVPGNTILFNSRKRNNDSRYRTNRFSYFRVTSRAYSLPSITVA
jgi:hypothetical protein